VNSPAIVVEDVRKKYRTRDCDALTAVNFTVEQGEIVGLLGPNGAGKTTLVKLICGITDPTEGQVRVFGENPMAEGGRAKNKLAVVHQTTPLDNMLSVIDNIKIAAAFKGLRWRYVRARVERMLAEFDLTDVAGKLAFTLSGGQQRRVQVIRALLEVPRLLLLDEPSAGLDVAGRRQVWELITKLSVEHGTTVLWTSHYIEEIERNCNRVLIVHRGHLLRCAPPAKLVDEFGHRSVTVTLTDPTDRDRLLVMMEGADIDVREKPTGLTLSGPGISAHLAGIAHLVHGATDRGALLEFHSPSLEDAFVALVEGSEGEAHRPCAG